MHAIHEFVLRGGQRLTVGAMNDFRQKIPLLNIKAETLDVPECPHLPAQIRFLSRFAEDVLDGKFDSPDLATVSETIFALGYVLKGVDIIPDSVPGIGYSDDSSVLRAVLTTHEKTFVAYAETIRQDFSSVGTEP